LPGIKKDDLKGFSTKRLERSFQGKKTRFVKKRGYLKRARGLAIFVVKKGPLRENPRMLLDRAKESGLLDDREQNATRFTDGAAVRVGVILEKAQRK